MSQEWRLQAPCRSTPDGPFLSGVELAAFIAGMCRECPVKAECLAEDPAGLEFGVYGGKTQRERRAAARKGKPNQRLAPCGSEAAYQRHCRWKEAACGPCLKAHTEHELTRRRLRRLRMARAVLNPSTTVVECGTPRGYRRHQRRREETCESCRRAWNDYVIERRNARAAA